jgi:outer membrane protein assembly factor BamB
MRKAGRTRTAGTTVAVVLTAALAACTNPQQSWVSADDTAPWPGQYGDARNSSYADISPASELVPAWNRSLGGPNSAPAAISPRGTVSVTAATPAGCTTFHLELTVGRKTYCYRDGQGIEQQTPLVDQHEYTYIGVPGWLITFDPTGQVRWRYATSGTPLHLAFAGDNNILAVTHTGQVVLVNSHDGTAEAASQQLIPGLATSDNAAGVADCPTAGPGCPVTGTPAVDIEHQRAYLAYQPPGAKTATLAALDFGEVKGTRTIRVAWQRTDLPGTVWGTPALSEDGRTLYVNTRENKLLAVHANDGSVKWSYDLGYATRSAPSVSPDGTLIPAAPGLQRQRFIALHDDGSAVRQLFARTDVAAVSPAAQIKGDTGYVVVRSWAGVQTQLLEFRTDTGTTLRSFDLNPDLKATTGVSIGPAGELVTVGDDGVVYAFTSGRRIGGGVDTH